MGKKNRKEKEKRDMKKWKIKELNVKEAKKKRDMKKWQNKELTVKRQEEETKADKNNPDNEDDDIIRREEMKAYDGTGYLHGGLNGVRALDVYMEEKKNKANEEALRSNDAIKKRGLAMSMPIHPSRGPNLEEMERRGIARTEISERLRCRLVGKRFDDGSQAGSH